MKTPDETIYRSQVSSRASVRRVSHYLKQADIEINGARAWDPQVRNTRFYEHVLYRGSLGLGDAYMDGWWECQDLAEFFRRLLIWRNKNLRDWRLRLPQLMLDIRRTVMNLQSTLRAKQVIDTHYELPVTLFEHMLGSTMAYSCAYWQEADGLDDAQRQKLDLICRKLNLKATDRVLDLGCGFGSFSRYAAEQYGCEIVAVTLSRSQAEFARKLCAGLPVEIHVCDYRDTVRYGASAPFDKIANIAMFEAVGKKNFRQFMQIVNRLLSDGGLWLLHTIASARCSMDPWLNRYIFPNGELPNLEALDRFSRDLFHVEDLHNLGPDYAPTLAAWRANFIRHWKTIRRVAPEHFDERFFRMWLYYLDCCRGSFLARNAHVWQLVMSKGIGPCRYQAVR